MSDAGAAHFAAFKQRLNEEYAQRFSRSSEHFLRTADRPLDGCSHAVRWNEPFMPVMTRTAGSHVTDLDGNDFIDYWQGHFANLLGHNPKLIRDALRSALEEGRGLQSGMLHEIEARVCELICDRTATEAVRVTTSGSLGTFYAALLCRAVTGRECVLKVKGGWHGSQPFGLKGVSPHGEAYDQLETEGLSRSAAGEILLTRYNDIEDLQRVFRDHGDRIACMLVEPMMGQGRGIAASPDYLREIRRLTEHHGAQMVCDEIITGFRFHAGDLTQLYGVRPDLLVLGKIIGGGMPVAAVAGRRELLGLCTREQHRVKFEGGTYSAHELSMLASATLMEHLVAEAGTVYPELAARGARLRAAIRAVAAEAQLPISMPRAPQPVGESSSIVMFHALREDGPDPSAPEEIAERQHPFLSERLLKSVLLLHGLSARTGLGALTTAHSRQDLSDTAQALGAALERLVDAKLIEKQTF